MLAVPLPTAAAGHAEASPAFPRRMPSSITAAAPSSPPRRRALRRRLLALDVKLPVHLNESGREAISLVERSRYLIAGDHFQRDRRRPGSTHLRIRRVHQQSSDTPTAHLWQDVEAVDMADPPSRPHEVRLIIKSDYKA